MYKLTERAAEDFAGIYDYTFVTFGVVQADHYTRALESFFATLTVMPYIGRAYQAVSGVMQVEFHRHVIFYTICGTDILIARILHQQMEHSLHIL